MSLELSNDLYNGQILIRGHAKFDEDTIFRFNSFKSGLNKIAGELVSGDEPRKEDYDKIIKLLHEFIIPPGFKITKRLNKANLTAFIASYATSLSDKDFVKFKWLLLNAGFLLSTVLPESLDEESLTLPAEFINERKIITKKYKDNQDNPKAKFQYIKDIEALAKKVLEWFVKNDNALGNFVDSKANGTLTHIQEILLGVGLSLNAAGEINDVITSSLVEGLEQTEYFSNSSQAIQALYSKSAETAKPGYLGKKLSNIASKLKFKDIDCGTYGRIQIQTKNKDYLKSWVGMNFSLERTGKTQEFKLEDVDKNLNKKLYFRSPYHCRAQGNYICKACFDQDYMRKMKITDNDNIGLLSSTGMLGSLINLTLKKSHTGISLNLEEVDLTKDLSQ